MNGDQHYQAQEPQIERSQRPDQTQQQAIQHSAAQGLRQLPLQVQSGIRRQRGLAC